MSSLYIIAVRLLDFGQSTVFFVGNFSFTQVVLIVSSFLQNDLLDAPSKSFHWTAITIYNASALVGLVVRRVLYLPWKRVFCDSSH